jgi:membrane-bound lytic murein transglycosylase A
MAQDTGGAIVGAVRADFFTGWGDEAAHLAGGLKQPLRLWALWPRR